MSWFDQSLVISCPNPDVYKFHTGAGSEVVFQNRQVIVASLSCCCMYSGGTPQSHNCWSSCNLQGKVGYGEKEDDGAIVMEVECVVCQQNLGFRQNSRIA